MNESASKRERLIVREPGYPDLHPASQPQLVPSGEFLVDPLEGELTASLAKALVETET